MTSRGRSDAISTRGALATSFGGEDPPLLERMLPLLIEAAEAEDIEASVVHASLEWVRLAEGLDGHERLALAALIGASLVSRQRGSTRLPLASTPSDPLDAWLEQLGERADAYAITCPDASTLREHIEALLEEGRAETIIGEPGSFRPLIWTGEALYHQQLWHYEYRFLEALRDRLQGEPLVSDPRAADATERIQEAMPRLPGSDGRMELNEAQTRAVRCAIRTPLTVVSGEPGTGKTAVIVSLLRAAARLEIPPHRIALAAPTGKAAKRIGDELRDQLNRIADPAAVDTQLRRELPEPQTLHRLLGYVPDRDAFRFGAHQPLETDLVVVDEVSMVDVYMMARLLEAVSDDARLVLIGDADQLPSVQNGAVFRDLVELLERESTSSRPESPPPVASEALAADGGHPASVRGSSSARAVRLTTNYRVRTASHAGSATILETARAINRGEADALLGDESPMHRRERADALTFEGVEYLPSASELGGVLSKWYDTWFRGGDVASPAEPFTFEEDSLTDASRRRLERWFERDARAQLLGLTRVFDTGTRRINRLFHRRYAAEFDRRRRDQSFMPGEPVIVLDNDYELGLFNGDRGIVVCIDRRDESRLAVAFRGRNDYRCVDLHRLRDHIQWSYALTVHKAQGSEFEHVGLILPREDHSILSREILYTGLTRARQSVALAGSETRLREGIERGLERHTGLEASRLAVDDDP